MNKKNIKIKYSDIEGNNGEEDACKFVFRPSIYGVLIERGKILLSKKWDGYDFPGGGMKINETIKETLKREFKEETGLKIKQGKLLACENSFFHTPYHKKFCNTILIYYKVIKIKGKLSIEGFDEGEKQYSGMPEWIPLNNINKIKFINSVDSIKIIKKEISKK